MSSSIALLLFGGSLHVNHTENQITVDGWLKLRAPAASAVMLTQVCSLLLLPLAVLCSAGAATSASNTRTATSVQVLSSSTILAL